jgi:hypothetical protein
VACTFRSDILSLAYKHFVVYVTGTPVEVVDPSSFLFILAKMSNTTDTFGVRIEASNSFVQAAIYGFLLVGVAAFAAPVVSTIRVLLSLFVLPGKSVCHQSLSEFKTIF